MASNEHPVFAFVYERMTRSAGDGWEAEHRRWVCGPAEGRVLEVGAGNGVNFAFYERADEVVAVEPEPNMRRRAEPRARAATVPVRVVDTGAVPLPFDDHAFDTVVCSLVLCTVPDLDAALHEIRRVLKPDGTLRFYEHVRSADPKMARWQHRLRKPWGAVGAGCHPDRDTMAGLSHHGFTGRYRGFVPPIPGGRFLPHVVGEAHPSP
jgi:ubiquinone/menaquinone biosynthesis C-methylase UbiE